jgi:hypothetical protein
MVDTFKNPPWALKLAITIIFMLLGVVTSIGSWTFIYLISDFKADQSKQQEQVTRVLESHSGQIRSLETNQAMIRTRLEIFVLPGSINKVTQ